MKYDRNGIGKTTFPNTLPLLLCLLYAVQPLQIHYFIFKYNLFSSVLLDAIPLQE